MSPPDASGPGGGGPRDTDLTELTRDETVRTVAPQGIPRVDPVVRIVGFADGSARDDTRWRLVRVLDALSVGTPCEVIADELRSAADRLDRVQAEIDRAVRLLPGPTLGAIRRRQETAA